MGETSTIIRVIAQQREQGAFGSLMLHDGLEWREQFAMVSPDELERYFQQRTEQDAFSGVVLITQGSSQLFAGTYGYASRSWNVPNTLTTRFDTASVTKLFTTLSRMMLYKGGQSS